MPYKIFNLSIGLIGMGLTAFFGGYTIAMEVLIISMIVDYISGLIVAGFFKNSEKTKSGGISSHYCWVGLLKKVMTLVLVGIGYQLDRLIGCDYIKDTICIAYTSNEIISIIENAGLMGLPIPKPLINAIDILKQKSESEDILHDENTD